ncbi:unnamed protein product [Caenorhabditis brenneri]
MSLLEMPEDVKRMIVEKLELKENLILRKVCHSLRNFIDDIRPPLPIPFLDFRIDGNNEKIEAFYGKNRVEYRGNLTVFEKELKIILNIFTPKSLIIRIKGAERSEFFEDFFKIFGKILTRPLKPQHLYMDILHPKNAISILNFLDFPPKSTIAIADPIANVDHRKGFKIFEIFEKLKSFNKLEEFQMRDYEIVDVGISDFLGLSFLKKIEISIENISAEELRRVKENFLLPTSNLQKFHINYSNFPDKPALIDIFGPPHHITKWGLPQDRWYYRTPNSEKILEIISYHIADSVHFSLIEKYMVSRDAIIQDYR